MTGKQLKDWAATVPDNAKIEVAEKHYSLWEENFRLRARTETVLEAKEETEEASA